MMNRLQRYILKQTGLPATIFMMDDIWSHKNGRSVMRYLLRREVKRLVPACKAHFAISEMMKREYDEVFKINCTILTKGVKAKEYQPDFTRLHRPLRMVYTGKLIYGRDKSLAKVAEALATINTDGKIKAELHIYTQTEITPQINNALNREGCCYLHKPVPYMEVAKILDEADIVLLVESLEKKQKYIARLSFSTKVTDYLGSGKCILAVGAEDIAPIEYLKKNEAAQICTSYETIYEQVIDLIKHQGKISQFAQNAYLLGTSKHSNELMSKRLFDVLRITK